MDDANVNGVDGAVRALRAFVDANARRDEPAMRACLSRRSAESGEFTGPQNSDASFSLGEPVVEGEAIVIPMRITPPGAPAPDPDLPAQLHDFPAIMIREDGEWKFDLAGSQERMMGALEGAMTGAVQQLGTAMSAAMDGMAEAFSQAFGESDERDEPDESAPSWDTVPLEPETHELYPQAHMVTLEKIEAAAEEALGFKILFRVDLSGLLDLLGSDETQVMKDWLEEQLLVNWPSMLARAGDRVPLEGQLHGVRIEPAASPGERFIALDLSEVVYRLNVQDMAGYYSDEEIERVLAGVLAGLPETIHESSAAMTVFPDRAQVPMSVSEYAATAAVRCMRRIEMLLGHGIALDAEWNEIDDVPGAGGKLHRWGLGRVVGGLALAIHDGGGFEAPVREELRVISLRAKYAAYERQISFVSGVLYITLGLGEDEAGCFYEVDIAEALAGRDMFVAATDATEMATSEDAAEEAEEPEEPEETEEPLTNLFDDAVKSLEEAVPAWKMQIDMALGHDTPLVVDWSSLGGDYALVQGMVHVGVVQSLGAICTVGFDPKTKEALAGAVQRVRIEHAPAGSGPRVMLADGVLVFRLDASTEGGPPDVTLAQDLSGVIGEASPATGPGLSRPEQALAYMTQLEAAMREADLWPGEPPAGGFEVKGAFGCENMAFEQWLAWVLIPRVKTIVAEGDSFPSGSMVATYAVRALDGVPGTDDVISVLYEFDRFIGAGA